MLCSDLFTCNDTRDPHMNDCNYSCLLKCDVVMFGTWAPILWRNHYPAILKTEAAHPQHCYYWLKKIRKVWQWCIIAWYNVYTNFQGNWFTDSRAKMGSHRQHGHLINLPFFPLNLQMPVLVFHHGLWKMTFCGKQNTDHAACFKNSINFFVA